MSNPEIDHRCAECGASVRSGATFCPQCGLKIGKDEESVEPVVSAAPSNIAESNRTIETPSEAVPDESETRPLISANPSPETTRTQPLRTSMVGPPLAKNVKAKVQRLKKVSSVVIDQAAYDPSLRFILVAAALFILCLFLLLLSRVLQ